jgi:hypothetical protein
MFKKAEEVIGYYIAENTSGFVQPHIISSSNDWVTIETVLQKGNHFNRNKRNYGTDALEEALRAPFIQERIRTKTWYGEGGHPITNDIRRLSDIAHNNITHVICDYRFEGDTLVGVLESGNTNAGRDFRGLILQGSQVAFSMRGFANVTKTREGDVIKKPLKIVTYDWVMNPSHDTAFMRKILTENVISYKDTTIAITESDIHSCLGTELTESVQSILESFKMSSDLNDKISLIHNGTSLKFKSENEVVIVPIRNLIRDKLRNL